MTDKTVDGGALDQNPAGKGAKGNEPELVEVKLGEKTVKLDAATAEAVKAIQETAEAAGVTARQLQAKLDVANRPADKKDGSEEPYDYETNLFTDPKGALARLRAEIVAEVEGKTNLKAAQKDYWDTFYQQNADLAGYRWVVDAVFSRDYATFGALTVGDSQKKLSETVKADLLKLRGGKNEADTTPGGEGGTESTRGRTKHDTGDKGSDAHRTGGLTATIKARRDARREARTGAAATK